MSVHEITAKINNGSILGMGSKPDSNSTNRHNTLSATHRLKNSFVHSKATVNTGSNRLSFVDAASSIDFNSGYIHFQDDWTTCGTLDVNRRLVASGNFSGCTYKVFNSGSGAFTCLHIARPSGKDADALVVLADDYAAQKKWTLVREVKTVGYIGVNGCKEIFLISYLSPNRQIHTIRVNLNNQGLIVDKELFVDKV